ncbi:MAG: M20/M25/M40 family metallo-hydrolase [Planctomycetes bacterium]|nr:M20/M25/M40 family metallo-hydrolase [Planctomycetota bacterium]
MRHHLLAVTTLALAALPLAAQTAADPNGDLPPIGDPSPPPDGAPPHLKLIDRDDLRRHAYWLADDARNGRYTGSAGQRATAEYVADRFKALGLKPIGDKRGFLQHYPLESVGLGPDTSLAFGDVEVTAGFAVLPHGDDDKINLRGKFTWCGNGAGDDLPSLRGRIPVVALHGLGGGRALGNRVQALQRFTAIARKLADRDAAAGVVCLLDDDSVYGDTLTTGALQPDHPMLQFGNGRGGGGGARVPLFVVNHEHGRALLAHLGVEIDPERGPGETATVDDATGALTIVVTRDKKASATNVVAVLNGTSKKREAVVISAHHDHVGGRLDGDAFNGADDNASGTAGLLEIAEAFAKGGPRPARSIVFLSVSGEELGLWGSRWFADNPAWPLDRIVADVNIDMIGRAGGSDEHPEMQVTPSHEHAMYSSMVREAVGLGDRFGIRFTSGDTYYRRSDHFNFAEKGIPVVFFCDGEHPDYHQVTDTPDKLRYAAMESIARLAFWTGWNVANDKQKPKVLGKQAAW